MANDRLDSEEAIIAAFWAPLAAEFPCAFGLRDDCAVIAPPDGCELVVTTDAIVEGVHVLPGADPGAVAWKALAVNVSDLIAKGATPLAYLMSLALPATVDRAFLPAFAAGLARAQRAFGCRLAGGDTDRTPGPLSVTIAAFGTIPRGSFVQRAGARPGDLVFVTGTIGDAALGLALRREPALAERWRLDGPAAARLQSRLETPEPPVALAPVVRAHARAAMDISDGLVKDFERLCRVSGVGGRLQAAHVPLSPPARTVIAGGGVSLDTLLTGGEDYEILAVAAPDRAQAFASEAAAVGCQLTQIGEILDAGAGVSVLDAEGRSMSFEVPGWDHFRPPARD